MHKTRNEEEINSLYIPFFIIVSRSFLIEEKCRFLSNFSSSTADVELPGEFLTPKHGHYYVRIARFMPRVEIAHKHNTAARRLYIRGSNGKVWTVVALPFGSFRVNSTNSSHLTLFKLDQIWFIGLFWLKKQKCQV